MHLVALPETLEIMRSIEPPKARSFPDSDKRLRIIAYSASSAVCGAPHTAEFEPNLRRERQLDGIAAAKARGVYKGRKPIISATEVQRLSRDEKLGATAIARRLGIGRASVYRVLGRPSRLAAAVE